MNAKAEDDRIRVFLSYSRKDLDFVVWLSSALQRHGCLTDFDRSTEDPGNVTAGISAEDAWWTRLEEMITSAEVIVFVVSPDSVKSKVCDEEIAFSQGMGKRIIPVLCRSIDFAKAPPRLSALNVKINFAEGDMDQVADSLLELTAAIHLDVKWFRTAARLASIAAHWDAAARTSDRLLRGAELLETEAWAARRPVSAPQHAVIILDFLAASRDAEEERKTIDAVEKARYLELVGVMRPFLEEEVRVREEMPESGHYGVAQEDRLELEFVRSLLHLEGKWHPEVAIHLTSLGAVDGYAEIFRFPCCQRVVKDFRSTGSTDPPSQFRSDGCKDVPKAVQYEYRERSNPFRSQLVQKYHESIGPRRSLLGSAVSLACCVLICR